MISSLAKVTVAITLGTWAVLGCNDASGDGFQASVADVSASRDAETDVDQSADTDVEPEFAADAQDLNASDSDGFDEDLTLDDAEPTDCDLSYVCRRLPALDALEMPVEIEAVGTSTGVVCGVVEGDSDVIESVPLQWERSADGGETWQSVSGESGLETVNIGGWSAPPYGEQQYRIADASCPEAPIVVDLALPGATSSATGMSLSWATRDSTPTADLDLFVLRHPDECWGDERHAVRRGIMWQFLDWGEPGPGDEPTEGSRDVVRDGEEWLLAPNRSPDEPWTVAGLIYSVPDGGTVEARMQIFENGAAVIDVTREFSEPTFWVVARVEANGWRLIDERQDSTTFLDCDIASRCPDDAGAHEICDGIDNDCDGAVDESPDACYNEGRGREFCSRVVIDDVEVAYVCRDLGEGNEFPSD